MVLAAAQPPRTMAGTPARPADVINLVINATDDELSAAFTAAGWNTAVALGLRADARTVLAVAEDRGYTLGPVSLQSWSGQPPDRVFQKQTNTFDRRHHVRIWRAAQTHERQARLGGQCDARHRHQVRARANARSPIASRPTSISNGRKSSTICVSPVCSSAPRSRAGWGFRRR